MLKVAQGLFEKAASNRSGIGSTKNIAALRSMVPFILPANVSREQPTHCGRNMLAPATGAAKTSIVVTHNMGRIAQGCWAVDNMGDFAPRVYRDPAGVATNSQQSIIADGALNQCLILFF